MTTPSASPSRPAGWRALLSTRLGALLQLILVVAAIVFFPPAFIWTPVLVALLCAVFIALAANPWPTLGFARPVVPAGRWITEGVVTGVLWQFVAVGVLLPTLNGALGVDSTPAGREGDLSYLMVGVIVYGVIHTLAKGLALRAFMLHRLHQLFAPEGAGQVMALITASLLFGLSSWHLGLAGAIVAGAAGLVFNLLFYWSRRNIWPTVVAHSAYNITLFILIYFGRV